MSYLVGVQFSQVTTMFVCGMCMGMLFDISALFRRRLIRYYRAELLAYFMTFVVGSYIFATFLYKCSHGVLSVHTIFMTVCGNIFYNKFIRKYCFGSEQEEK